MNINKVTISGADDAVDPADLLRLQQKYPFVEWGILVSTKRAGTDRYPSFGWRRSLNHHDLNICFHLCGSICRDFIGGEYIALGECGVVEAQRYQFNILLNESRYLVALRMLANYFRKRDDAGFILPYNKGSREVLNAFIKEQSSSLPDNVHFLYDSSGGRGTPITIFQRPLPTYTGYAGGISQNNIFEVCDAISNMMWEDNVWIDMESGVRTDEKFDLAKVERALSIAAVFIK